MLIVAEHASAVFGGEAALPLHYFRVLRERGADVQLLVHERTRDEMQALFPDETRIHYVHDTPFQRLMCRIGERLPARIESFTTGFAVRLATQLAQRAMVRRLVREGGVEVVHQPMPVSPREPSLLFGFGVPVVIGPMNGGIDFPPAFSAYQSAVVDAALALGRAASQLLNRLLPGKLHSEVLLVANERTRLALPAGRRGEVVELVENGVDLALWAQAVPEAKRDGEAMRFVFVGRLVDWKGVDLLLQAFAQAAPGHPMSLLVVGEGPERGPLEAHCVAQGLLAAEEWEAGKVAFAGWRSQAECAELLAQSDALVLPSLMECGGAVVLEAMACGRPVIATDWGGPPDYLDASCGILVAPDSRPAFVAGLADAMRRLADSYDTRCAMGEAGRDKVVRLFDWERKVDRVVGIYREALRVRGMATQVPARAGCAPRRSG